MKKIICVFINMIALCINITTCAINWTVVEVNRIPVPVGTKIGMYYFRLNQNYDNRFKQGLEYSYDGITFDAVPNVRTNSLPEYRHGLYFILDKSNALVPVQKRFVGFSNAPSYILNESLNVVNIIYDQCYVTYKGYINNYHYLCYTFYIPNSQLNNWESRQENYFYKTTNGLDLIEVDKNTDDLLFLGGINTLSDAFIKKQKDCIQNKYYYKDAVLDIVYENSGFCDFTYIDSTIPLFRINLNNGNFDKSTDIEIKKSYLSVDGINYIEMPIDIGDFIFEYNNVLYFERNDFQYYAISKTELCNNIKIVLNSILSFEVPPTTENDRTLVPMRFLFEQMGADVAWDDDTQSITVTKDDYTVTFSIDNQTAIVNGVPKQMDVPARLISDKTMIPLRFLSEELGYTVTWDEETKTATITE